jgi:hypothetical protein
MQRIKNFFEKISKERLFDLTWQEMTLTECGHPSLLCTTRIAKKLILLI